MTTGQEWACKEQLPVEFFRETLERLAELIDWGVQITDADGFTVYYNEEASRLDGIDSSVAMGKHILEMFPSLSEEESTVMKVLRTGVPILKQEQEITNLNGFKMHLYTNTLPLAVDGKIVGALDISKDLSIVKGLMEKVIGLREEVRKYKHQQPSGANEEARYTFHDIIGESPSITAVKERAVKVAASNSPIFVYGETGTGKELLVQAVHNMSSRKDGPFIAHNCAALPETLMDSILFGTVKGSFTGAENRPGLIELADGGTLFLDEISTLSFDLQAKLLRFLQEPYIRRVGDSKSRKVDVRIISASNVDPQEALEKRLLRPDLVYRLNVISLRLPTLKERKSDIPILTNHFLAEFSWQMGCKVKGVSKEVEKVFLNYPWPGNVRELRGVTECAFNLCETDVIQLHDLPEYILRGTFVDADATMSADDDEQDLRVLMQEMERELIRKALNRSGGNTSKAAKMLGLPRQTLQYKLKTLGIEHHDL